MTTTITRWDSKAPGERVVVTFDFSGTTASVSAPTVTCVRHWNAPTYPANDTPSAMLSGSPSINGAQVLQAVVAGLDWNDYTFSCSATSAEGEILIITARLPVRANA